MAIKRVAYDEFETTVTDIDGNEYDITVSYIGYSDPGKLYGPPENCYPPEGEIYLGQVRGLPAGVQISDKEMERVEQEAWEHLANYQRGREYEPRD